ncbi:MAG: hypothetical protein NTV97_27325 [Alphaproteobacteria bacterium]|nr:hypothetical protein [Alphaproteobacteria bacterium]
MRESLLKKKLRLAADLKLLVPVTSQIIDIANYFAPATAANHRRIVAFDASSGEDGRRWLVLVFGEDGDCHLIDTQYAENCYVPDTIPHDLDLVKVEARLKSSRRRSDAAFERELRVRLFIHFIEAINPKIDNGHGRYMAFEDAWNEAKPGGPRPKNVKSFQEHLDMVAWSDPSAAISEPFILQWNGHPPSWPDNFTSELVNWEKEEDFAGFRSSLLAGEWGSLSIKGKALLTERFVAACWCLCWQFDDGLVDDTTDLEYNDDDGERRSGYDLERSSEPVEFVIRSPTVAGKNIARRKYANWLKRLQFYSAGWRRHRKTYIEFTGDRSGRSRSEMAKLRKAFVAAEAGTEPFDPFGDGLFIPAILIGA